ncbi:hypothetical protein SAY86_030955 [Trapa natans]|uniref:Transcriptional coactivator Hfi1/Transcriptional adapter 1 n=1 Tax=Trapa natans TaxID=22666 RepID=A0AAN7M5Z1_TRANT|nr:hypothetical protein SAY86_030955 [Trapa natans]
MQRPQSLRIDLGDLKAQIVKRIGAERSKNYFYYLNRFLSRRLSKSEFDKLCGRVLGRENLPLHNQFIRSILKNACLGNAAPPTKGMYSMKSALTVARASPTLEDGHELSGSLLQNQSHNSSIWSNGIIPVSPRKGRSAIRDRKVKDRPSMLWPNGKVDCLQQSIGKDENESKITTENDVLTPRDTSKSLRHLHVLPEQPEKEQEGLIPQSVDRSMVGINSEAATVNTKDMEKGGHYRSSRTPLLAPLGVPLWSCKFSFSGTSCDTLSCQDLGELFDMETLKRQMEHIVAAQGLGGVSAECANLLNNMLDVYLKRLISSSIKVAETRDVHQLQRNFEPRLQIPGRVLNGMHPTNTTHLNMQNSAGLHDRMNDKPHHSISLLDFKVAMELNPQQLGVAWPQLLELISTS